MQKYILALDQGTTGSTALVIAPDLTVKGKATNEFQQHFPKPGWVEHDLEQIWASLWKSVREALALAKVDAKEIAAIGITNQRETTCLWHKGEGAKPVAKAIVWQDRRTADVCAKLKKKGLERSVHKKTGLVLDPYFSGTKLEWLLKNVSGAMAGAREGKILFGTIETYLLYRMTGSHATDISNASRTLLMDLKKGAWDDDLLKLFKVPRACLPTIMPSAVEYGRTKGVPGLPDGIPVTGLAGDQQAALFGQACFSKGMAKCTYGTGAFILLNTGTTPVFSKHKLLTTACWQLGDEITYALEGSAFIAGAAVQWLRDGLNLFEKSAEVEKLAAEVPDSDGVFFVPALTGLGAPHWFPGATGLLTGLTRRTTKHHVARATLEGVSYQIAELLQAMVKDTGKKLSVLRVDGGASADDIMMQFQADLLGTEVLRSEIMETTALGAGCQAGLGIGMWKDLAEIQKSWRKAENFKPSIPPKERASKMARWAQVIEAVRLLS